MQEKLQTHTKHGRITNTNSQGGPQPKRTVHMLITLSACSPQAFVLLVLINTVQYPTCQRFLEVLIQLTKGLQGRCKAGQLPSKTYYSITTPFRGCELPSLSLTPEPAQRKFSLSLSPTLLHKSNNYVCMLFQTDRKK